jgi:hypothetical protein
MTTNCKNKHAQATQTLFVPFRAVTRKKQVTLRAFSSKELVHGGLVGS